MEAQPRTGKAGAPGSLQTEVERQVGPRLAAIFESSPDPLEVKLATFPRYARRSHLTRFLALYELFKLVLPVKGSIVECGVFRGFSFMTWAKLSAVLEPNNLTRRIYGFDSFAGFPDVGEMDEPARVGVAQGDLYAGAEKELRELIEVFDQDRFLGHLEKAILLPGDLMKTLPSFLEVNPHLLISLLFLDLDLYEPTRLALDLLVPRMPRGAVVAFDELDNPTWPGETRALLDTLGASSLSLERLEFDPYIAFARIP
jgi:Macrocin-O-methyltransferase (TylF)